MAWAFPLPSPTWVVAATASPSPQPTATGPPSSARLAPCTLPPALTELSLAPGGDLELPSLSGFLPLSAEEVGADVPESPGAPAPTKALVLPWPLPDPHPQDEICRLVGLGSRSSGQAPLPRHHLAAGGRSWQWLPEYDTAYAGGRNVHLGRRYGKGQESWAHEPEWHGARPETQITPVLCLSPTRGPRYFGPQEAGKTLENPSGTERESMWPSACSRLSSLQEVSLTGFPSRPLHTSHQMQSLKRSITVTLSL